MVSKKEHLEVSEWYYEQLKNYDINLIKEAKLYAEKKFPLK